MGNREREKERKEDDETTEGKREDGRCAEEQIRKVESHY